MPSDSFDRDVGETFLVTVGSVHARTVTLNMGMRTPAWFDFFGLGASAREDSDGIGQATRIVHGMIDAEEIPLGDFSMGGAVALYAGLTYPHKLARTVGLSSFLVQRDKLPWACLRFESTSERFRTVL
ncbi:acyl-protein thioesterase 1 domain protein [Ostertagia ostertagi]